MVTLSDAASGARLGQLTDEQFQELADALEEEGLEDRDYYLNLATLDLLRERQADEALVRTLENALAGREELDIRWERA